jgi:hypothetical protein
MNEIRLSAKTLQNTLFENEPLQSQMNKNKPSLSLPHPHTAGGPKSIPTLVSPIQVSHPAAATATALMTRLLRCCGPAAP